MFKESTTDNVIEDQQLDYHIYKLYKVMGQIGKGTYGQVYKVQHKKSKQLFAIKKICHAFQNIIDAKRTYRQLNYLFQLSHPCIVKLFQIIPINGLGNSSSTQRRQTNNFSSVGSGYGFNINRQNNTSRTQIQNYHLYRNLKDQSPGLGYVTEKMYDGHSSNSKLNNKHVYAVFQYVQSDLSKAMRLCNMQSIQRKYIVFQILNGILYLHNSKLIHRDIKPSNILIDSNCDVKICDFGLCRLKTNNDTEDKNQTVITQYVASRWYRPPEILLGFSPCNQAIDMWGIGCLMAQLVLKTPLFQGTSTMDQLEKIFRVIGLPKDSQINRLQTQQARYILRNFNFSRKNKPQKLNQVLFNATDEQIDLIEKLLKYDPNSRISAQQALKHPYFSEMEQMNYNFQTFNYPVKIVDHTEPSTFLDDFKFSHLSENSNQKFQEQNLKGMKKKEATLEQYQCYIQQLQRATSRSSNRNYGNQGQKEKLNYQDKIIQDKNIPLYKQNSAVEGHYNHQKSTRQSNFLTQHCQRQVKPKDKIKSTDLQSNQSWIQGEQKSQKIATTYNRQVYSMNENYFKAVEDRFKGIQNQNENLLPMSQREHRNIQENLEQYYGVLNKQQIEINNNSKGYITPITPNNIKKTNCIKNTKIPNDKKNPSLKKNRSNKSTNSNQHSNKSSTKQSGDNKYRKQPHQKISFISSHSNKTLQEKPKYSSYSSLIDPTIMKREHKPLIPTMKKPKQNPAFKPKTVSKNKSIQMQSGKSKDKIQSKQKNINNQTIGSFSKHIKCQNNFQKVQQSANKSIEVFKTTQKLNKSKQKTIKTQTTEYTFKNILIDKPEKSKQKRTGSSKIKSVDKKAKKSSSNKNLKPK